MEFSSPKREALLPHHLWQSTPVVIALVGGGGKTSLAFWLASQARAQGLSTLVTTTTRMFTPEQHQADHLVTEPDPARLISRLAAVTRQAERPQITFCCRQQLTDSGKVTGLAAEQLAAIKQSGLFQVMLVEADGAHRCPLKAPAAHEPCIPQGADVVLGVTGGEVLFRPLVPEQIHRWQQLCTITGACAGESLDQPLLVKLINHPQGLFKGAPAAARKIWVINKYDLLTPELPDTALLSGILDQVLSHSPALGAIWLTEMRHGGVLRAELS